MRSHDASERAGTRLLLVALRVRFVWLSWTASAGAQPNALAEARKLIDAGQPAAAVEKLRADTSANPRVAELLGVAYFHANDPAKAIATLTPVIERLEAGSPEHREAVQVLGLAHVL